MFSLGTMRNSNRGRTGRTLVQNCSRAAAVSTWFDGTNRVIRSRPVNPQVPGSTPGRGAKILNQLRPVLAAGSFRKKPVVPQFFGHLVGVTLWPARYLTYVSLICRSA
jgi:hypothetical protein